MHQAPAKKINREAKNEFNQRKNNEMEREVKQANASETSEIENVVPESALFSVDVNLENLQQHLSQIKNVLKTQEQLIFELDRKILLRATEK